MPDSRACKGHVSPDRAPDVDRCAAGIRHVLDRGGDDVAKALAKWWNTPASKSFAEQFEHVAWEGFRFYDLIFPLFLFTVGVVLPFSLRKYQTGDQPKAGRFRPPRAQGVAPVLAGLDL